MKATAVRRIWLPDTGTINVPKRWRTDRKAYALLSMHGWKWNYDAFSFERVKR